MIVGAPGEGRDSSFLVGAAFIFRRSTNDLWLEESRLQPIDTIAGDQFGRSVAIQGDRCIVGAPGHDAAGNNAGAVYIYRKEPTGWTLESKLFALTSQSNSSFGESVDIDGDTLAVGSHLYDISDSLRDAGAAYIFTYSGSSWHTNAMVTEPSAAGTNYFGMTLCLRNNNLLVGAPYADVVGADAGSASLFHPFLFSWDIVVTQRFTAPFPSTRDFFGSDVAIDGDWIVVGARGDDTVVSVNSGSAHVFHWDQTWQWMEVIVPSDATDGCGFGSAVAMDQHQLVIGSPSDNTFASLAGAGYCYLRVDDGWSLNNKLISNQARSYPPMGWSAAVHDGTTVLGAWQANQPDGSGSATIFDCSPPPLVLIPGIAGSVMEKNDVGYWPSILYGTIEELHPLTGTPDIEAVDIIRYFATASVYGDLIAHLVNDRGYVEYDHRAAAEPFTSDYLVTNKFQQRPNLFLFPYDWRRSNADHSSTLRAYIDRIRGLHNGRKVNVIAHSMGGLVFRRFVLDHTVPAEESVAHVATVGSPLWGAPVGIYRLITGEFFDLLGILDSLTGSTMRDLLFAIPGMHELLPSTLYFANGGLILMKESGYDGNRDGQHDDLYSRNGVMDFIEIIANHHGYPATPFTNNILFHDGNGMRQDDWSTDSPSIKYLHIIGTGVKTPTQVVLRSSGYRLRPTFPLTFRPPQPLVEKVYGPGDGTVSILGARRAAMGQSSPFWAPNTVTPYEVPAKGDAGHNTMLNRSHVWDAIFSFFEGAPIPALPASLSVQTDGWFRVTIYGVGFVDVYDDEGNTNTPVNEFAVLSVPDVAPTYGTDEPWCILDIEETKQVWIRGRFTNEAEQGVIEVVRYNAANQPVALYRYSLGVTSSPWRVGITSAIPEVARDLNNDQSFEPTEIISPSYQAAHPAGVDAMPPQLGATLSISSTNLVLTLNGNDPPFDDPVSIFYSTGTVSVSQYSESLTFPINKQGSVACYAEDSFGNRSGWLSIVLNPIISISGTNIGTVVQWPWTDGYTLEQTIDLRGSWIPVKAELLENGSTFQAVLAPTNSAIYRLRFVGINL